MDLHELEKIGERSKKANPALISKVFTTIMMRDKELVVDFVRSRWKEGKRPSGDIIGEYAWISYEMYKRSKNPLADGNVDLHDTGDLSEGLTLFPRGNANFTIFSTDKKAILVAEQYGLDVYGLTKEEEEVVVALVAAETNEAILEYIINNKSLPT